MSIKNFFVGCLVGGISGVLSVVVMLPLSLFGFFIIPGVVFGIVTLFYFSFFTRKDGGLIQPMAWIFMCGVSYFTAVITTIQGPQGNNCRDFGCDYLPMAFILGGVIGATLLVISFKFLINKISTIFILLVISCGGVMAFPWIFINTIPKDLQPFIPYVGWQSIICGLLAASQKDVVFKSSS